jgi:hypothetical protein
VLPSGVGNSDAAWNTGGFDTFRHIHRVPQIS